MTQKPSVGRIVHYRCPSERGLVAALITSVVKDDVVTLTLFRPGSAAEPVIGTVEQGTWAGSWSFPERV